MMNIFVNNSPKEVKDNTNLIMLLAELGYNLGVVGIAVAINNELIPKKKWEIVELNENDKVTILRAACGG